MTTPLAFETLNKIVEQGLKDNPLPYQQGKTIFLGNIIIRNNKHGYVIIDRDQNKTVYKTFSKRAALAIAKNYIEDKSFEKIVNLDQKYEKHSNDCVFYLHNIQNTKDENKKEMLEHRLDTSCFEIQLLKDNLDRIILN